MEGAVSNALATVQSSSPSCEYHILKRSRGGVDGDGEKAPTALDMLETAHEQMPCNRYINSSDLIFPLTNTVCTGYGANIQPRIQQTTISTP